MTKAIESVRWFIACCRGKDNIKREQVGPLLSVLATGACVIALLSMLFEPLVKGLSWIGGGI